MKKIEFYNQKNEKFIPILNQATHSKSTTHFPNLPPQQNDEYLLTVFNYKKLEKFGIDNIKIIKIGKEIFKNFKIFEKRKKVYLIIVPQIKKK